jgi:hypothetical protein
MATIEGKSSAEWFKDAAQRQKRSNAYAKYEEPAKPEPARQTAAMPKPANHASPAKAAEPAKKVAAAKPTPRPKTSEEEGRERIEAAKKMIADYRPEKVEIKEAPKGPSEAEAKAAESARQRRLDERAATPGPVAIARGLGTMGAGAATGIAKATKEALKSTGRQYSGLAKYAGSEMEKGKRMYAGIGRWLGGDPDAKKRLQAAK